MKHDIKALKQNAIAVFEDSLMPNGALVAAPSHQPYYPVDAKSYLYSWPGRDGGFSLAAMILLGKDYYTPVLSWLWNRVEDFHESHDPMMIGRIFRNYHVNGLMKRTAYQPDQAGTLLWSIGFKQEITGKTLTTLEKKVAKHLANGLIRVWENDRFCVSTEELWEERQLQPLEGIFSYSLAACATGLFAAEKYIHHTKAGVVAKQMRELLIARCWSKQQQHFPHSFGGTNPEGMIDGSLPGLVWPFNVGFKKEELTQTLAAIENNITDDHGVHRYPHDKYEGADSHNHTNEKAGAWPLLTFWLSIGYAELGDIKQAKKYFELPFKHIEDPRYIPEQLFCCEVVPWTGVSPLVWSHAMAVFAAWKLGLLKAK